MFQSEDNNILITGGAGYIGSHIVKALVEKKTNNFIVFDNLSTGFADSLPPSTQLVVADLLDKEAINNVIQKQKIKTIIHLAAKTVIPESIANPQDYYLNNTMGTLNLLRACLDYKVPYFIYSSTAAVYGNTSMSKITEEMIPSPVNPYGHSKLMSEQFIKDIAQQHPLKYIILRYFNVAGAAIDASIGQRALNATHLIKVAAQTACGINKQLSIFGEDYPTPDGTCIRDFIHVCDLAQAHLDALNYLNAGGDSCTSNCGYGNGYSVKEVIKTFEAIIKKPLPTQFCARRAGDLPAVVANNSKIKQVLGFKPTFDDLSLIVGSALAWEKKICSRLPVSVDKAFD